MESYVKLVGVKARMTEKERRKALKASRMEQQQHQTAALREEQARKLASPMRWSRKGGARAQSRSPLRQWGDEDVVEMPTIMEMSGPGGTYRGRAAAVASSVAAHSQTATLKRNNRSPSPHCHRGQLPGSYPSRTRRQDAPSISTLETNRRRAKKEEARAAREDARAQASRAKSANADRRIFELTAEKVRLEMKLFMSAEEKGSFDDQSYIEGPSVPILTGWRELSSGGVSGTIYWSPEYDDGELIQTSAVVFGGRPPRNGTLVQTKSGKKYFLDMYYEPYESDRWRSASANRRYSSDSYGYSGSYETESAI